MASVIAEVEKISEDIKSMRIRGAGRIARAAAEALQITTKSSKAKNIDDFIGELEASAKLLLETRPTAVSLPNGVRYIMKRVQEARNKTGNLDEVKAYAVKASSDFITESQEAVRRIGEIGARRIDNADTILTHCNSENAIAILRTAWKEGKHINVYVTETRPKFQGRYTAEILSREGILVTLIVDSAARYFMNKIDKVVVGADAVAANGAVVNKVGTSLIALAAKEARTLFFVGAETYKFSPATAVGELVKIEERDASEVVPPENLKNFGSITVKNPAFDVTPPEYIDLIITEKGVIPPQAAITVIQQEFGWSLFEDHMRSITVTEEE